MPSRPSLPSGNAPRPVDFPHFPDTLHAVVFRNWELVPVERLAAVLRGTTTELTGIARSMGLAARPSLSPHSLRRGYITIIRRNWHLLPYEQLVALLGWDDEKMAFTLREDDFLYHKMGLHKPACPPVFYAAPGSKAQAQAKRIRQTIERYLGDALSSPGELPFSFLDELSTPTAEAAGAAPGGPAPGRVAPGLVAPAHVEGQGMSLRMIYSYAALYGDPLLDPECDPYPDAYLDRLASLGVNAVWMQGIVPTLSRWDLSPQGSDRFEERLANLGKLARRVREHGIGLYLYFNEPRAMPLAFFDKHPELKGVTDLDHAALCTSVPETRAHLEESLASIYAAVPELEGAFTISMSENLTNCHSKGRGAECPRCSTRTPAEVVAEVNTTIAAGIHAGNPRAKVIVWDWAWANEWACDAIDRLPRDVWLMSVSEWSLPIERGGIRSEVGEYSISAPGPGPRALRHWARARQRGLHTMAKIQANNTWELSAVPYIPAPPLIAEHMDGLADAGVDGVLLSWTLGGYPSPNLQVAARFYDGGSPGPREPVRKVAEQRFGAAAAADVTGAWETMSDAFRQFPYHIATAYLAPQNYGPAALLYERPTGYTATMIGFPYDDLDGWRAIYPREVFLAQFRALADAWRTGVDMMRAVAARHPSPALAGELRIAEAAGLHFRSVADQVAFVVARDGDHAGITGILEREIQSACRMFQLVNADSRIGFEASNHYYYVRLDLVEKVLDCASLMESYQRASHSSMTE